MYFFYFLFFYYGVLCYASYHEQYRVPRVFSDKWESYAFEDKEYIIQNLPVSWENAKILCRGHHNGTLAIVDTKEKAAFLAEAMSESQLLVESVWVGSRRSGADDPAGYRWEHGVELRRTAADVLAIEREQDVGKHYPVWLNRTSVPVPEGGADCVGLERIFHDKPVFVDLPCHLERAFVCEKDSQAPVHAEELKVVRCRTGLYHVYDGLLNWHEAAAFCVIRKMSLANIGTMRCMKKLGLTMLKTRPSIENAWVGARGTLGNWTWIDTGLSIFLTPSYTDAEHGAWPPLRDRSDVKQSGCLQLDRHSSHPPIFMEARCERRMQFICYQGALGLRTHIEPPSDDFYYYVLVRQKYYWQHAYENCQKLNGSLASINNNEILIQLLLLMGENKEEPIDHVWISGRLNVTKDETDSINYTWYNPTNGKKIAKVHSDDPTEPYVLPWLDEEFSKDNSCLNLDRQDHINGLVYGLPCDTPQYSICMIDKTKPIINENLVPFSDVTDAT